MQIFNNKVGKISSDSADPEPDPVLTAVIISSDALNQVQSVVIHNVHCFRAQNYIFLLWVNNIYIR